MARPDERSKFEFGTGGVLRRQTNICLDGRGFTLPDCQHWNNLDAHEKWVEVVSPVPEYIVLQSHLPAGIEERLEVLIIVMQFILVAKKGLNKRADFAPGGRVLPICAITTPISLAGTWTQGNFRMRYLSQSLNRTPGMRSPA